jgi:hypothetical protein
MRTEDERKSGEAGGQSEPKTCYVSSALHRMFVEGTSWFALNCEQWRKELSLLKAAILDEGNGIRVELSAVKERTVITKSSDFGRRQRNFRTTHDGSDGYRILPLSQTWPVQGRFPASAKPSTLLSEPYCPQCLKAKRLLYVPATLILTIQAFLAQYMHEFGNIFTTNSDNFPT